MKRTSLIAFAFLTVSACVSPDERSAMELAERIVPAYADNISFVQTEDTVDVFELSMKGDRLALHHWYIQSFHNRLTLNNHHKWQRKSAFDLHPI